MTIVRELVTVLGTQVDASGFKQYETGIERLKASALGLGKLFGIAFSIEKIVEFADGLVDAGKEVNKIAAQLKLIARPMDDVNETMQGVFELSQRLGVSYTHMLDTYKEFANEVRDTNIPTEKLLTAVETIQKGFEVARATPEQQSQVMDALQRGFRSGKMRPVSVGLMKDILPPEAFNMLLREFNLGVGEKGEEALREMAKKGEISAERVVAAFSKTNATLDKQFQEVPQKLGRVFTRIYNDLVKVTAQIYKIANASSFMGQVVWYMWTRFRDTVVKVTEALGGLENVVSVLSIAFLVFLARAVALTIQWAIASWAAVLPWVAMGAAILAVAVAIQDIVYWVQGKKNLIGTFVGPFAELKENFKSLDIFAGFRAISDLFKGDFSGFKKEFKILMDSMQAEIALLITAIAGIGAAFWLLSPTIKAIINLVKGIGTAAVESEAKVKATEAAAKAKGSVPEVIPGSGSKGLPGPRSPLAGGVAYGLNLFNILDLMRQQKEDALAGKEVVKPLDALMQTEIGKKVEAGYQEMNKTILGWLKGAGSRLLYGPEAIQKESGVIPGVAPGAIGGPQVNSGPVNNSVNPSLTQTNNIKVETMLDAAQIGAIIGDRVQAAGEAMLNGYTRDLQRAGPRTEKATQ